MRFDFRRELVFALVLILLLAGCQSGDEINRLKSEVDLAGFKLALMQAKDSNNPVVRFDSLQSVISITLEDGATFSTLISHISSIEQNWENWEANIKFNDGTTVVTPLLGKLKLDSTIFTVDPFGRNPLAALATIKTPIKGKFRIVVKGKPAGGVSLSKSFSNYSDQHQIPILGLYPNYKNRIRFFFQDKNGKDRDSVDLFVTTASLPVNPTIKTVTRLNFKDQGLYFNSNVPVAYDQNGDIRWYYTGDCGAVYRKLKNGNIAIVSAADASYYYSKSFYEVSMMGQIVKKYIVPNYLHHEIIELPSGNFLVASNSKPFVLGSGKLVEDFIVEIDRVSGKVVKSWDFNQILDPTRKALPDSSPEDWLHINSIFYQASDNSILVSGRSQSVVAKIDYNSGAVKWILANPNYWPSTFNSVLLTPVGAEGNTDFWPYGQHAASFLANGNLLLFDNGDYRNYYDNLNASQNSYSRIAEYKINESAKTVELTWQFKYNGIFTMYTGNTELLTNNNYFIAFMFGPGPDTPKVMEVNKSGVVQFESNFTLGPPTYYRSYKAGIYDGIQ